jgi:hypothetical protein
MPRRKNCPITSAEATRAIYLDFESPGRKKDGFDPPPVLAGVLFDSRYESFVLRSEWRAVCVAKQLLCLSLDEFLESILDLARSESRRIVYWSSNEDSLFHSRGYPPGEIGFDVIIPARKIEWIKDRFTQFRADSKRFRSPATAKTVKARLRTITFGLLSLICKEAGFARPSGYGAGKVGKWIRHVTTQEGKINYEKWSPGGKAAFTKLAKHNEHDCRATEHLLGCLVKELGSPIA